MDMPQEPIIYKRKYGDHDEVSFSDLRAAYETAAGMVADHGDKYLPLFERLDQAMQERQHQESVKARALEVARQKAQRHKNKRRHSDLLKN